MEIIKEFNHSPNPSEDDEVHLSSNAILFKSDSAYKSSGANSKKVSGEETKESEHAQKEPINQQKINTNNNNSTSNININNITPNEDDGDHTQDVIPSNMIDVIGSKKKENNIIIKNDYPRTGGTSPVKSRRSQLQNLLSQEKSKKKEKKENIFSIKPTRLAADKKIRKDRRGIVITKSNRRKVKITFADQIDEEPLVDVVFIESFKKYNVMQGMPKEDLYLGGRTEARCNCCAIY